MARERKLYQKQRARKGTGRSKNRPVQVSEELHDELSIIKAAYAKCLGKPVTFEQMLRRWVDRLPRIDADVNDEYQEIRKAKEKNRQHLESVGIVVENIVDELEQRAKDNGTSLKEEAMKEQERVKATMADARAVTLLPGTEASSASVDEREQHHEPVAKAVKSSDPTEGEVWKMDYFFEKDGVRLKAFVGTRGAAFYTVFNGKETGLGTMIYSHHWKFINGDGIELTKDQAEIISERIRAHKE